MPKRILQGTVVSTANAKTITVSVERRVMHSVQKKTVRRNKKYHAHDPDGIAQLGDTVRIRECAPISRTKRWELLTESVIAKSTSDEATRVDELPAAAMPSAEMAAEAAPPASEGEAT